jgi:hypothetical protein
LSTLCQSAAARSLGAARFGENQMSTTWERRVSPAARREKGPALGCCRQPGRCNRVGEHHGRKPVGAPCHDSAAGRRRIGCVAPTKAGARREGQARRNRRAAKAGWQQRDVRPGCCAFDELNAFPLRGAPRKNHKTLKSCALPITELERRS